MDRYCGNFAVPDPHDLGLPNGDYFDKLFHDRQVCVCVWGGGGAYRVLLVYMCGYMEKMLTDVEMKVLKRGMHMRMKRLSERMPLVCVGDEAA